MTSVMCLLFGHKDISTDYKEWKETGMNFVCLRCGNKWKRLADIT